MDNSPVLAAPRQAAVVNGKHSITSTWRRADKSTWTIWHHLIDYLDLHPTKLDKPVPVFAKTDKIPYMPQWKLHAYILFHSFIPLAAHQFYVAVTQHNPGKYAVWLYYSVAFELLVVRSVYLIRDMAYVYGYLDGDVHARDEIPDSAVSGIANLLHKFTLARMVMAVYWTYDPADSPMHAMTSLAWWAMLLVHLSLYPVAVDFWFYWYHRAMHDVPGLWQFHRTHHLTKHPNALLSAYADHTQELFDIAGIPFLALMSLRFAGLGPDFYQLWFCHQYIAFTEAGGHSGLRVHITSPSPINKLLVAFGLELALEDHDLHHRKGWRKSHNYGKQTRVWDRLFGTCLDRIESADHNIDFTNTASIFH